MFSTADRAVVVTCHAAHILGDYAPTGRIGQPGYRVTVGWQSPGQGIGEGWGATVMWGQ